MAQILCSKSGILFNCEYMPVTLSAREYYHPLFTVPKKRLLSLAGKWAAGQLPATESYLLFLSLLDSTELILWRTSARYTDRSAAIVANNMESLLHIIGKIDVIKHPSFTLPKFAIQYDTGDLSNVYHWIQSWHQNYLDWQDGYKFASIEREVEQREIALSRLIKSPSISKPEKVAAILADWAEVAGDFPDFLTVHPKTHTKIPLSDYWKQIIKACVSSERIWHFPSSDLEELITHCEENIEHGSIHAAALMKHLRAGRDKQISYSGFDDMDLMETKFQLMPDSHDTNDALSVNSIAIINSAPESEPLPAQYPTKFAYIRAKLNWEMAQRNKKLPQKSQKPDQKPDTEFGV